MAANPNVLPELSTSWWCDDCSSLGVNPPNNSSDVLCPFCNNGAPQRVTLRHVMLSIPLLVPCPMTAPSSSRGGEVEYLPERIVFIDPLNQATVVPSSSLDPQVIDYVSRFLRRTNEIVLLPSTPSSSSTSTRPAAWESVKEMPTVKVEEDQEDVECPVCLERLGGGGGRGACRQMPCKHSFHQRCILKWLAEHNTCPLCRFQLPVQESQPVAVSGNTNLQNPERHGDQHVGRRRRRRVILPLSLLTAEAVSSPDVNSNGTMDEEGSS